MNKFLITIVFISLLACGCKHDGEKEILGNSTILTIIADTIISTQIAEEEIKIDNKKTGWTELTANDNVAIDIRYATANNFTKEIIYPCQACFVRDTFAQVLLNINKELLDSFGYKLKFFDCYRPSLVQQRLWDKFPNPSYVTNPKKGSMHNRGMAIDITILDQKGNELDMGTEYDFFGEKAHYAFEDLPSKVKENRKLLRSIMEKYGCIGIRTEWWHFSLKSPSYEISNWEWKCN